MADDHSTAGTTEAEEWRVVPSLGGRYSVSSLGRVRREADGVGTYSGRILRPGVDRHGYLRTNLRTEGTTRYQIRYVHRLVAEAFLPPVQGKAVINHIDMNKLNNRPSNLEWTTLGDNVLHAWANGSVRPCFRGGSKPGRKFRPRARG